MKSHRPVRRLAALLAALCLGAAGCTAGTPTGTSGDPKPRRSAGPTVKSASAEPPGGKSPGPAASAGVLPASPAASPLAAPNKGYFGRVLGLDGNPAANVRIEARIIANHAGSLITDNGSGVLANHSAGMIANQDGGLVANNSAAFRLLAADEVLTATSGADGTFTLAIPAGRQANVEAIQAADVKAIRGAVTSDGGGFDLRLAPTGSLKGKVTTPPDRQITNYQGVDVYIPGTSYLAKADAAGNFQIDHVPVGAYKLFAEKVGLGSGVSGAVEVRSREAAQVSDLMLQVEPVTITAIEPPFGLPGSTVTVTGTNFGKSSGAIFKLLLGGIAIADATVVSDTQATFRLPKRSAGGDLVVEVNGLPSAAKPYAVIDGFEVTGPDTHLGVGATFQSKVSATDVNYEPLKDVVLPLSWKVATGDAVTVDQAGKITAVKEGVAAVDATFGGYRARLDVTVSAAAAVAGNLGGATARAASGLSGVSAGADGQIFLTSRGRVFKLGAGGDLTTVAGGVAGEEVLDAAGKAARFEGITALAGEPGRLLVGDGGRIREVKPLDGAVKTLAGSLELDLAGEPTQLDGLGAAAQLAKVESLAPTTGGAAFFLDGGKLRRLAADGAVTTIAGAPSLTALGVGPDGTVYAVGEKVVYRLDAAGLATAIAPQTAPASWPGLTSGAATGLACDAAGNIYLAFETGVARLTAADGTVARLAGSAAQGQVDAATGFDARFMLIRGLAYDAAGDALLVAEDGAIRRIALGEAAHPVSTIVHREAGSILVTAEPIDADPAAGGDEQDVPDEEAF